MEKSGFTGYPDLPTEPPPSYYPQQPAAAPHAGFAQQPAYGPQPGFAPQSGFAPQPAAPTHTQTVIRVIQTPNLGPETTRMTCPFCQADVSTRVEYQPSGMTHVAAALLCLFGFWCCVCIPYCTDSCMDAQHACPNCHKFLGQYRRWSVRNILKRGNHLLKCRVLENIEIRLKNFLLTAKLFLRN